MDLAISEDKGRQVVNARDLHSALGIGRDFSTWIKDRIEKYGFLEGRDYQKLDSPELGNQAGWGGDRRSVNYLLTLSTAKEIAVVENNEKGREIRHYLITIEEAWNSPTAIMARALQAASQELAAMGLKIAEYRPKVEFYDQVADSSDAIQMRDVAAALNIPGWGRNKLFALLRKQGIVDSRNIPYREYQDRGYFRVVEQRWADSEGETHINLKTLVYQKGVDYIRNLAMRVK
jgi:anti-repressor protein